MVAYKMSSKQDFGSFDESNGAWNCLRDDLKDWEKVHPTSLFISPKKFKSLPFYECCTKQSFSDAYFLLLEKRCKLSMAFFKFPYEAFSQKKFSNFNNSGL